MSKTNLLDELLLNNNGYLICDNVINLGISKTYLLEYVRKNNLKRVAHGVYLSNEFWKDDLYILSLKNERAIISHETALQIHGLTERESNSIHVSVPYTYNARHLRINGIKVHQIKDELYPLGIIQSKTKFGNTIRVYDIERTICDIIKYRNKMDEQVFLYAIKEYAHSKNKNLIILMEYAKKLKITNQVKMYMELII